MKKPQPDHRYVALSYVWGFHPQRQAVDINDNSLPLHLPKVIEDAIKVT